MKVAIVVLVALALASAASAFNIMNIKTGADFAKFQVEALQNAVGANGARIPPIVATNYSLSSTNTSLTPSTFTNLTSSTNSSSYTLSTPSFSSNSSSLSSSSSYSSYSSSTSYFSSYYSATYGSSASPINNNTVPGYVNPQDWITSHCSATKTATIGTFVFDTNGASDPLPFCSTSSSFGNMNTADVYINSVSSPFNTNALQTTFIYYSCAIPTTSSMFSFQDAILKVVLPHVSTSSEYSFCQAADVCNQISNTNSTRATTETTFCAGSAATSRYLEFASVLESATANNGYTISLVFGASNDVKSSPGFDASTCSGDTTRAKADGKYLVVCDFPAPTTSAASSMAAPAVAAVAAAATLAVAF